MAALRISDRELANLAELHARELGVLDAAEDLGVLRAIDVEFHRTIGVAARNQRLLDVVQGIRLDLRLGLDVLGWSAARRRESTAGHVDIIRALAQHDASATATAMSRHVEGDTNYDRNCSCRPRHPIDRRRGPRASSGLKAATSVGPNQGRILRSVYLL